MFGSPFVIASAETELFIAKIKEVTEKYLGEKITEMCEVHMSFIQDGEKMHIRCYPVEMEKREK